MSSRYDTGMSTRRAVLGDAHVDRAEAAKTEFDAAFQSLITEAAWGTVWADDSITQRERSMITLALLAATGNFDEIPMHIRATANTGASSTWIERLPVRRKPSVLRTTLKSFASSRSTSTISLGRNSRS